MPRIPEETIQQVLHATDIVDVVGRVVKLRRAGANFVGLCPFHNEKTASFNVSPSRNSYHCFGCGVGGSPIRFLMEHDGMTFVEAVKRLADAAGITIEQKEWSAQDEKEARIRSALVRVHQKIGEWYHRLLMKEEAGAPARDYLKSRGIRAQVAKGWQLGYAPKGGDALRRWAEEQGFSEKLLVAAGILARSDDGRSYPRFRDRLMFPICNDNSEIIAFSGRLLDPEAKGAKYLNSPETPIFNKSRVLFGFHKTKRAVAKSSQVVVCEGQIDLIMAHEAGFENVAAPLGTAFTEYHARVLKRHADEVVLCYDSDAAGLKAAERSFRILAPTGLTVKMAALPAGDDPDTLIRREGPEAFSKLLEEADEFIDFQIEHAAQDPHFSEMRTRVQFAEAMAHNIRYLESPVAQSTAVQRVALRLGLPEQDLRRELAKEQRKPSARSGFAEREPVSAGTAVLAPQNRAAETLCLLALHRPEVIGWMRGLTPPHWLDQMPGMELLARVWHGRFDPQDPASMGAAMAGLDSATEHALATLLAKAPPPGDTEAAQQLLRGLEDEFRRTHQQMLETQLKDPEISEERVMEIQSELLRMRKESLDRQRDETNI